MAKPGAMRRLLFLLLGLGLCLIAQSEVSAGRLQNGLALHLVAAIVCLRSGSGGEEPVLPCFAPQEPLLQWWRRRLWFLVPAIVLAFDSFLLFGRAQGAWWAWPPYLGALLLLGLAAREGLGGNRQPGERRPWCALVAIVAVGAFMRLHRLSWFPPGVYYDEATNALEALYALDRHEFPPYFPGKLGYYGRYGTLYEYLLMIFLAICGPSELALRLSASFPGIVTVPCFYLLARQLLPKPVALLAAFLFACSRWHTNFSRIAFDAILTPTAVALAWYLLVSGVRRSQRGRFLLVGLVLGLGLLAYDALRLLPLVVVLSLFLLWLGRHLRLAELVSALAIVLLAALTAATPALFALHKDPKAFWGRAKDVVIWRNRTPWQAREDILANVWDHLAMFQFRGDRNGRHNLPGSPMLDGPAAAFFLLGMAVSLSGWRRPASLLPLVWLGGMLLQGMLTLRFESPQALRSIGAIPAAYLIAALPFVRLLVLWQEAFAARGSLPVRLLLLCGGLWALVAGYRGFFLRQARDFAVWSAFSTAETVMAREVARLGPGHRVEIDPLLSRHPTMRLLAPWFVEPEPFSAPTLLPLPEGGEKGTVLFITPTNGELARLAERWYPGAQRRLYTSPQGGQPLLYEFLLSAQDLQGPQGLLCLSSTEDGQRTLILPQLLLRPEHRGQTLLCQGVLLVPRTGEYGVRLAGGEGSILAVDGAPALELPARAEAVLKLAEGRHALLAQLAPAAEFSLLWRPPGQAEWQPVPKECLYRAPVEAGGLQADYLPGAGEDWGAPALSRVEPYIDYYFHIIPLPRPYRIRWHGWLLPPAPGEYVFSLQARDHAELWLGGQKVLATAAPDTPTSAAVALSGPASVEVRFWDETGYTGVHLRWRRPDGVQEVVPVSALLPPAPAVR